MMIKLPPLLLERLKKIIPKSHWESVLNSFSAHKAITFRVNTLKVPIDETVKQFIKLGLRTEQLANFDNVFQIDSTDKNLLTSSQIFLNGNIYIQNLSSMLPVLALDPQPGEEILDLCAAPGSKTTQIATLMKNEGRLAAVEKVKSRYFKLKDNLKTQGVSCAHTYLKDGAMVWRSCRERFDRVLVDAPCSSEGRICLNEPDSFKFWSERKISEMARKQWRLLYSGFMSLKPGGTMIYSTCSFAPEENELMIQKLIKKCGAQVNLLPLDFPGIITQPGLTQWQDKTLDPSIQLCRRILPNEALDGFFIAHIQKKPAHRIGDEPA